MEDVSEKLPNIIRYIGMAFRPANVLIFCFCLTVLIAVPCVVAIYKAPQDSAGYSAAMAILTGVIASGLVSISIELANNYRHNRQRFVILNEYLYMVSMYEQFIIWASHGAYRPYSDESGINWFAKELECTKREQAVAEIILEFGPVIEQAVLSGREYLSIKELQFATRAVDAADKLGEHIGDIINNHLTSRQHSFYDLLDEPLREKIKEFSEDVDIYIVDQHLEDVVGDYVLCHLDELGHLSDDEEINELDSLTRNLIIHRLRDFDKAMHALQEFVKQEPVIYDNLVPMKEKMKRWEKKLGISGDRKKDELQCADD